MRVTSSPTHVANFTRHAAIYRVVVNATNQTPSRTAHTDSKKTSLSSANWDTTCLFSFRSGNRHRLFWPNVRQCACQNTSIDPFFFVRTSFPETPPSVQSLSFKRWNGVCRVSKQEQIVSMFAASRTLKRVSFRRQIALTPVVGQWFRNKQSVSATLMPTVVHTASVDTQNAKASDAQIGEYCFVFGPTDNSNTQKLASHVRLANVVTM